MKGWRTLARHGGWLTRCGVGQRPEWTRFFRRPVLVLRAAEWSKRVCVRPAGSHLFSRSTRLPPLRSVTGRGRADGPVDCPQCRGESWSFERVVALGAYTGMLRDVVLRLKHAESHALGISSGGPARTTRRSRTCPELPQVVVPVPMYWYRRFRRGINSASALARGSLPGTRRPPRPAHAVWCCRSTRKQSMLSAAERPANVRGAFRCRSHPRDGSASTSRSWMIR